jgi:hypothetical protein
VATATAAVHDTGAIGPAARTARPADVHTTSRRVRLRLPRPDAVDKLLTGIVVERPAFIGVGQRGCEHIGPEDTFDGDYGRLLERIHGEGLASPTGFEPVF